MNRVKIILSVLTVFLIIGNVNAQLSRTGNWCATDQNEKFLENDKSRGGKEAFEKYIREYITNVPQSKKGGGDKASPYIIPVVFHCITDNGAGYCSKASIEDQIERLNKDFQRINLDTSNTRPLFKPYAMSMDIEFRLAHKDPNGKCTEGIVRTDSPLSTACIPRDAVKSVSYWDSKKYFNIWVVNSIDPNGATGIVLGYAQFPYTGINNTYGIVIDNDYVSANDRTLTHEMGHCFGLLHTFQSGCGSNCSTTGDRVCDTPPASTSTFGCNPSQNSCSNDASGPSVYGSNVVDQIENYMSYDDCQNMFTLGQKLRMEAVLNSTSTSTGLNQLNKAANHAATGVANPYSPPACAPIADFSYNEKYICEGESISFTDDSYNGIPTSWSWTFAGGTPNTSAVANPSITYNTEGVYDVTHQPSNASGSGTETKTSIITVSSLTARYSGPLVYGFENGWHYNNDWIVENPSGAGWERNSAASSSGSSSISISNYDTDVDGEIDEIISPSYNISALTSKTMTFKQAFAKKSAADSDRLFVYFSTDCGQTWVFGTLITAVNLPSVNVTHVARFVPGSEDWVTRTVNLNSVSNATNVRFKFQFRSGGGNDLYIDDINIGNGSVGVEDLSDILSFKVYPNPTNSSAQISFNLVKDIKALSIKVRNAVGQEVTNVINTQSFSSGEYTLKIDEERKLASGIYFIEFNADNNIKVQKLIVQ